VAAAVADLVVVATHAHTFTHTHTVAFQVAAAVADLVAVATHAHALTHVHTVAFQVAAAVADVVAAAKDEILTARYKINTGVLLGKVRERLRWADGGVMKKEMDAQVAALLGPRTAADDAKPVKTKAKKEKVTCPDALCVHS
jgi:hypothetical protein